MRGVDGGHPSRDDENEKRSSHSSDRRRFLLGSAIVGAAPLVPREAASDVMPPRRTPDEFDRETGAPLPNRARPRPGKAEMWRK